MTTQVPTYRISPEKWAEMARARETDPVPVRETTATTGTGPLTLGGAVAGFRAASAVYAVGDVFQGAVTDGVDWEYGYFTLKAGGVVARSLIQGSTNMGGPVNWSAGSKVFLANIPDAERALHLMTFSVITPVARGGTGLSSGVSGGVLGFTAAGVIASSVALTANAIVLGGGAGATPTPLGSLGTATTVLHGNISGAPTFSAVSLTADVSGTLPLANGGTNANLSLTGGAGQYLKQNSVGGAVTVGTIAAADVVTGAALTRTNDTNVTVTLGGSPSTALLAASSLALGWSGQLAPSRGGLGANNSATSGTFPRGDGTNFVTSGITLPNTLTAAQVLYGTATNAVGGSAGYTYSTTGGLLVTASTDGSGLNVLNSTLTPQVRLSTGSANAGARDWRIIANYSNFGDFQIQQGTTAGGAPTTGIFILSATTAAFPTIGTTANAANAYLDNGAGNSLLRVTSSARYKTALELIERDEAIDITMGLAATAMRYRSLSLNDDPRREFYGHIAENVETIDRRLVNYVRGIPESVQYERIPVLHSIVITDHELRLRNLEGRKSK